MKDLNNLSLGDAIEWICLLLVVFLVGGIIYGLFKSIFHPVPHSGSSPCVMNTYYGDDGCSDIYGK